MGVRDAGTVSTPEKDLTVGVVASMVGVSVRTLHHWDEIGLVRPSARTWSDYRVYSRDDVARIHRVLVYREVGIPLAQIATLLDDPGVDETAHLARQRELLAARIDRLQEMVSAVDRMLEATTMNEKISAQEISEIFGSDWLSEPQERWGDTAQWAQTQERTAQMSREDWEAVKAETDALDADLAAAVNGGLAPGSPEANALVERHRAAVGRFYDCTHEMHVCMGQMYLTDDHWSGHYESLAPGLTRWLHDAIVENARAHGVDPETARWR